MRMPKAEALSRALAWVLVPLVYPNYRRLVIRSMVLSLRLEVLSALVTVLAPIATPGLLLTMRGWFDRLRADVREFGRAVRAQRAATAAQLAQTRGFQNPWL